MTKLMVDIGGTYIRFALSKDGANFVNDPHKMKHENFSSIEGALQSFLAQNSIDTAAITYLAIAKSGRNNWECNERNLAQIFTNAQIALINDFEANAHGLVGCAPDDLLHQAGPPTEQTNKTRAVIGSGTGLGLAYITPQGEVLRTHGGHMLPCLINKDHIVLFDELQKFKTNNTIPIFEDALSGNGIVNIYKVLAGKGHVYADYRDTHHLLQNGKNDPVVRQALKIYHEWLGLFAHEVLAFGGSYGALYLTGGITDWLIGHDLFDTQTFLDALYQKTVSVVADDVRATPIYWVKDEFISLKGLLRMAA